MISMYTGSVGSGKSYHALELGMEWIRKKHVIANFPIIPPKAWTKRGKKKWEKKVDRWTYMEEISVEYLMALSLENGWYGKESSCMVLIDEAGIMFNSRDWQSARGARMKWIKFLSQSRKFGYDFVFVCQMDRMIDKQIRGLCEYEVKHLKANNAIFFKWLSMFKITLFMYNYRWYQTKVKGNLRFSIYRPSVGNRYDTMRVFNLEELIENMKMVYEGKIIPSAVAAQLVIWEEEVKDKMMKLEEEKKAMEALK